jgi:hypothetical protein
MAIHRVVAAALPPQVCSKIHRARSSRARKRGSSLKQATLGKQIRPQPRICCRGKPGLDRLHPKFTVCMTGCDTHELLSSPRLIEGAQSGREHPPPCGAKLPPSDISALPSAPHLTTLKVRPGFLPVDLVVSDTPRWPRGRARSLANRGGWQHGWTLPPRVTL